MKKVAIDLNDVVRDYSRNFMKYYLEGYNHEFDLKDFEFWTNDMKALFPFTSDASYNNFVYNDYAYELFGKCQTCSKDLAVALNEWLEVLIPDLDAEDKVEFIFVSPMEYGLSIGSSLFFLSKLATRVREFYFPKDSSDIWNRCDILITANPKLLGEKPEGKKSIKIKTEYNGDAEADYEFITFEAFLKNKDNIKILLEDETE